jgi:hypothetical protein
MGVRTVAYKDRFHRPSTKETKKIRSEEKKRGEKLGKGEE